MSCKNERCVCEKVRLIADAQDQVNDHCCTSSCERSIDELLSPTSSDKNTIPFLLLCGCESKFPGKPFFGTGVKVDDGCFKTVHSPFFRVKKFVEGTECCAILELLFPHDRSDCKHRGFRRFARSGICLEVDLSCFTGITCFPAVNADNSNTMRGCDLDAAMDLIEDMRDDL
ncbi:hypothetical protein N781_00895 [Pontibacillus halophilus JSM 076056 = DSM 19796]|uniref:Spore coat protein n=1 Tax=Pontibacillus halophilus JSM 076056 = DSM 19796 TaxID=1385510 RepID=A0A0A5GLC0_9BACI|nr:CotY/CotZ family spore coat protein [Pontibacillus halophilus]KGX94061.1 hypothetical protein N781_00895 [Pontibacillus halophilus JSM 076056 = DSM 19796]